jgi:hypothetical protein
MTSVDETGLLTHAVSSRDHAQVSPDATVTLVEYGDYEFHTAVARIRS